jgi:hypothetical protein
MLSMMDVGPNDTAMAYIPNEAAVPDLVAAKLTSTILRNIPIPQTHTVDVRQVVGGGWRETYKHWRGFLERR